MFLLAAVPPPLRGVVRRLAAYDEASGSPVRRRQAPTGAATLILGLGGPLRIDDRPLGSLLGGLSDTAVVTEFSGHQAGVQVDLAPLGLMRLLGAPGQEVSGSPVATGDLTTLSPAGRTLAVLPARLGALGSWSARLDLVTDTLTSLLADSAVAPDPGPALPARRRPARPRTRGARGPPPAHRRRRPGLRVRRPRPPRPRLPRARRVQPAGLRRGVGHGGSRRRRGRTHLRTPRGPRCPRHRTGTASTMNR